MRWDLDYFSTQNLVPTIYLVKLQKLFLIFIYRKKNDKKSFLRHQINDIRFFFLDIRSMLTKHKVFRFEKLSMRSGHDAVHRSRFKIHARPWSHICPCWSRCWCTPAEGIWDPYQCSYTEKTILPLPFTLNGIGSWWQFSFRFWIKWNSIWFKIERKTVTMILTHSMWKVLEV